MTTTSGSTVSRRRQDSFDAELRRAARALATGELPRGILDPALRTAVGHRGSASSRPALGGAGLAAAALVVLAVAVIVRLGQPPTGAPVFRETTAIRAEAAAAGYRCREGSGVLDPTSTGADPKPAEMAVCLTPTSIEPVRGALIVLEQPLGMIVEIGVKADIVGAPNAERFATMADSIVELASASIATDVTRAAVGTWIRDGLPGLAVGGRTATTIAGLSLALDRDTETSYHLAIRPMDR